MAHLNNVAELGGLLPDRKVKDNTKKLLRRQLKLKKCPKKMKISVKVQKQLVQKQKLEEIQKENLREGNKTLTFKGMFFDIFKIEMYEKYGDIEEESDYDDEEEIGETIVEQNGFPRGQCEFIVKSEAGQKTHITVRHNQVKSKSCRD